MKRAALDDYRKRSEGYNRTADEGRAALRGQIRDQIKRYNEAALRAGRTDDPQDHVRAKNEKAKITSLLQSRDAVARGRKAASTPGQGDLFGTPAPQRGQSPFERRVAERRAMLAAAGERAKGRQGAVQAMADRMLANRRNAVAYAAREDRAALLAARLQGRAAFGPDTKRGAIAYDRLQRLTQAYPQAGRLGAQIRAEQKLETQKSVQRTMRLSPSASRSGAGLPAQRSSRMENLLRRASDVQARREATRKRVKNTLAGRVSQAVKARGQRPKAGQRAAA